MSRRFRLTILIGLILVLLGSTAVSASAASPAAETWTGALAAKIGAWLDQLWTPLERAAFSQDVAGGGNTYPNQDPDGLSTASEGEPAANGSGGNTYPNQDPNG